MASRPERLVSLLEDVARERLSLRTGSPSDTEIAREQLADLAVAYIPELVETVQALQADQMKQFEGGLSMKNFIMTQGEELNTTKKALVEATARATKAESRAAELRGQVTSLLEDFANGCVAMKMEPGIITPPYWRGVNTERAKGLQWAELKCKELGIQWPIKPIPYAGNLPSAAPTPLPSSPAAAGPGEAEDKKRPYHIPSAKQAREIAHRIGYGPYSPPLAKQVREKAQHIINSTHREPWRAVFPTKAEYDASVQSVVERIESGEVKPIYAVPDTFLDLDVCECDFAKPTTPEDKWIEDLFIGSNCCHCGGKIKAGAAPTPTGERKEVTGA